MSHYILNDGEIEDILTNFPDVSDDDLEEEDEMADKLIDNAIIDMEVDELDCTSSSTIDCSDEESLDNSIEDPDYMSDGNDDDWENMSDSDTDEPEWKKTNWSEEQLESPNFDENKIRPVAELRLTNQTSPLAFFLQYFNDEVIDLIIDQTNLFAEQSKTKNWDPLSREELLKFIGKPKGSFVKNWKL